MPILHVFHVHQNGKQDFIVNLYLKFWVLFVQITTFALHFHDEEALFGNSKSNTQKQKKVNILNCPYFLVIRFFGLKFYMNYLSLSYNDVVL